MAKSIRSKRRRKMRAVRREKFGKKELERLKALVERSKDTDVEMKDICTVKTAAELKQHNTEEKKTEFQNPSSLQNEHGNYPVWMSQRKIKKIKKAQKKRAKTNAKKK